MPASRIQALGLTSDAQAQGLRLLGFGRSSPGLEAVGIEAVVEDLRLLGLRLLFEYSRQEMLATKKETGQAFASFLLLYCQIHLLCCRTRCSSNTSSEFNVGNTVVYFLRTTNRRLPTEYCVTINNCSYTRSLQNCKN